MIQYMTISTSQRNIEQKLGAYQNAGWQIVSRELINGSKYRIVLSRQAKHLDYIGMVGTLLFITVVILLFI